MARHIIQNRLTDPADLQGFLASGYRYEADGSDSETMLFTRNYPEPDLRHGISKIRDNAADIMKAIHVETSLIPRQPARLVRIAGRNLAILPRPFVFPTLPTLARLHRMKRSFRPICPTAARLCRS